MALKNETILSAESKYKAISSYIKTSAAGTNSYGYGWFITTTPRNTQLVHHSSGDQIVAANFRRFTDEDVVIIEFTDNVWGPYRRIRDEINKTTFGGEPPLMPAPHVQYTRSLLQNLDGRYLASVGREK